MSYSLSVTYDDLYLRYITQGQSISTIAKTDGVTSTSVRRMLKRFNIATRPSSRDLKKADAHKRNRIPTVVTGDSFIATIGKDTLQDLYQVKGLSGVEIAAMYGVNSTNVYNALKYYNIATTCDNFYSTVTATTLHELYINQQKSVYDIGALYGVDSQRVVTALKHHNIQIKTKSSRALDAQRSAWNQTSISRINDKEWLTQQLAELTQLEVAEQLGCSQTAISDACKRFNISQVRKLSAPHRKIQDFLTLEGISYETNNRSEISPYELDIVIPQHRLAIEINGEWWHCDAHERIHVNYHQTKTQRCLDQGWTLFQVWCREINDPNLFEILKDKIRTFVNSAIIRVFARKCDIVKLSSKVASLYFDSTHIQQGKATASIHYALQINNDTVACISFKRKFDGGLYLSRFSSNRNTIVVGGFSKLLKHAIKQLNPTYIETYSNGRFHKHHNVYAATGFVCEGWTPPNYEYLKNGRFISRQQAQKHKLVKWLQSYDPSLTEHENMKRAGWHRLYDCGHVRYRLTIR